MTRCLDSRFRAALTCSAALADKTMLSLRYPKLWLGFGWAMLIAVTVGSLLPGIDRLNVVSSCVIVVALSWRVSVISRMSSSVIRLLVSVLLWRCVFDNVQLILGKVR